MREPGAAPLGVYYGDAFYKDHLSISYSSGKLILGHLWQYLQPDTVLDVGCGRGAWLAACRGLGAKELYGLDGDWNNQASMIDPDIHFRPVDLNQPFALDWPVDMVMSLEVAEHLEPGCSIRFVDCLTKASDVVLFGAAYLEQGGTNHINERRHSWWANVFMERGYVPFDLFRPAFWGDDRIPFWYRQNTFLYVKRGCKSYSALRAAGVRELQELAFVDCVHPIMYESKAGITISFRSILRDFFPSFLRAVRYRVIRARKTVTGSH